MLLKSHVSFSVLYPVNTSAEQLTHRAFCFPFVHGTSTLISYISNHSLLQLFYQVKAYTFQEEVTKSSTSFYCHFKTLDMEVYYSITLRRLLTGKLHKPVAKESKLKKKKKFNKFCENLLGACFISLQHQGGRLPHAVHVASVILTQSFISCQSQASSSVRKNFPVFLSVVPCLEKLF